MTERAVAGLRERGGLAAARVLHRVGEVLKLLPVELAQSLGDRPSELRAQLAESFL